MAEFFNEHPITWIVVATLIKFAVIALFAINLAAILTWMERRQSALAQDRLGPHRAHFFTLFGKPVTLLGLLHPVADGLKMFFKEFATPDLADRGIFRAAPLVGFVTALMTLALLPFGPDVNTGLGGALDVIPLQVARLDVGLLFVFAVGSLSVYGAAMAGWASNNRFALLGGLRAAAQSISYEIALGLTVVGIIICYGTTEPSAIVQAQSGMLNNFLPNWGIFMQPFAAVLFLVAAIAETKRAPFDLPEGESEIIGYFVEYSSMGFGLFMLSEFVEIVVLGALFTTLFLGGWQFPWVLGNESVFLGFVTLKGPWVHGIFGFLFFGLKVFFMCVLQLQIRWTLPRFRYDQLMRLGWKNLLPLALLNIAVTTLVVWKDPSLKLLSQVGLAIIAVFILVVIAGPKAARVGAH